MASQNCAVIDSNGIVVNVVIADPASFKVAGFSVVPLTSGAGIGWAYSNGTFTAPNQPPQNPQIVAQQAVSECLVQGISITSAGTPAINGVYSLNSEILANLTAIETYVLRNNAFPGGGQSMKIIDIEGNAKVFPSPAVFNAFATAVADYMAPIALYALSGGEQGALPSSNAVSIS